MTDDGNDEEVVELTPDLIAQGQGEGARADGDLSPRLAKPPPSSPFTLLVAPRTEQERREERQSFLPAQPRESRPPFVPSPRADAVTATPIRKLGEETEQEEADTTTAKGREAPAVDVERDASDDAPGVEDEDEILDLVQAYVVDGQVSDAEVGTEPIPLMRESMSPEPPAGEVPVTPAEAVADEPAPRAVQEDKEVGEEEDGAQAETRDEGTAAVASGGADVHPFDFGTPEMVFDRVAEEEEELEEVDEAELEEEEEEEQQQEQQQRQEEQQEQPRQAACEPDDEEIDLADVMEVAAPPVPVQLAPTAAPAGDETRRRRRRSKKEWWASIFDDDFLAVMPAYSKRDVRRELDWIIDGLGVEPGDLVLDLACGAGRHAIGMARRNYRVVGVDLSLPMLARAGELAQEADQKINFIHGDMRDLGFDQTFDGVYCMGTSFGYFDDQVNVKVIEGVHRALKPGGTFLLEIANRDHTITRQPNLLWFEMGDVVSMEETDFNYINSRLYVNRQIILDGGQRQTKHEYSVRLYSLHEIGQIMHNSGFAVARVSGHASTAGAFFGVDSQKLIIVAQRRR